MISDRGQSRVLSARDMKSGIDFDSSKRDTVPVEISDTFLKKRKYSKQDPLCSTA